MPEFLVPRPEGFEVGYNPITRAGEKDADTGIDFGILKLEAGESTHLASDLECAYLLMTGDLEFNWGSESRIVSRRSIFDEEPFALHLPGGVEGRLTARDECELAVCRTANRATFEPRLFDGQTLLESEHRGRGLLEDTAYRIVRTIFDGRNRPEANLVLGEVINFPGRWSSYPPHHHPQPEIYHYRFTEPQGYGHGELGDTVYKIRQFDTLKILDERDHSQTSAPGYGMYYIWVIRHLPGEPYTVPEFTEEHRWTLDPGNRGWRPAAWSNEGEE